MRELLFRSTYQRLLKIFPFLLFTVCVLGQKTITVVDEVGNRLIGVEVFTADFEFATVSDVNGKLEVPAIHDEAILTFRYLGFEKKEIDLSKIDLQNPTVTLIPTSEILEEVLLVGRNDIRSRDFLQKVDAIQNTDIAASNPQTSADALSRYADVYVQKSQMGGGSPVIRGFEANKVLLVVDGVRMNNAIYRNGHLQNAITVDNAVLDQMEVIYGPSSLMYGSDALGGVIHFRTKDPVLNLTEDKKMLNFGNYYARYGSANHEKSIHGDINLGFKKWGSLTSVTLSDFDDLRMGSWRTKKYPDYGKRTQFQTQGETLLLSPWPATIDTIVDNPNENIQVRTGYSQLDLLQKFKYQISDAMNLVANVQFSTSSDIPRYDQLTLRNPRIFEFAEWNYGPQERLLLSLKYKWTEQKPWMDELIVIASRQDIEESRIQRRFGAVNRQIGIESVGVTGLTADVKKEFNTGRKQTIYYGADANLNTVGSVAMEKSILDGSINEKIFTRYPSGGSTMSIFGAYVQYINQSPDSTMVYHGGLRYSSYNTKVKYSASDPIRWPDYFYDGITATNSSVSWSAGVNWKPNQNWTIRLLTSSAFRAPNVDDIGKLRINNDNVLVPNADLDAEQSLNGEININRRLGRGSSFSTSLFYTRLSDAIIRQEFTLPDGSPTFRDGNRTYDVEANVNAEEAQIYGISANLDVMVFRSTRISTSLNYIRGQVLGAEEQPLAHIPPLYGKTQIKFRKGAWNLTLLSQYNAAKSLDQFGGSTDNPEYATPEGALGWAVVNMYADYDWNKYTFQVGLENIFDKHYIPFASGVSAPGINLILAIRGRF